MFFDKVVANLMFFRQIMWQTKSYKYKQKTQKSTNFVASCGKVNYDTCSFFDNLPQNFVEIILRGKKKLFLKIFFRIFNRLFVKFFIF